MIFPSNGKRRGPIQQKPRAVKSGGAEGFHQLRGSRPRETGRTARFQVVLTTEALHMSNSIPKLVNDLENATTEAPAPDPFDLDFLRLDQSFLEGVGVRKVLNTVPVRKPNAQDFIRVRPGERYRLPLAVIELKDDREIYLLPPPIAQQLPGEYAMATLYLGINRQGVVFLWPVKLPGSDGKIMVWHTSAAEAAELATRRWIRVKANMSLGAYEIYEAAATIPDPTWPDLTYQEILRIAFKDRYVDGLDHPVVKRLRGLT